MKLGGMTSTIISKGMERLGTCLAAVVPLAKKNANVNQDIKHDTRGFDMKKSRRIAILIGTVLIFMIVYPYFVKLLRRRDVPPAYIMTDVDLIKWMGRPAWIIKYSSTNEFYYEIGKSELLLLSMFTASSGSPSYTVDQTGRFIGWSPDSGAIAKPDQIHSENMAREKIDVDVFLMKLDH